MGIFDWETPHPREKAVRLDSELARRRGKVDETFAIETELSPRWFGTGVKAYTSGLREEKDEGGSLIEKFREVEWFTPKALQFGYRPTALPLGFETQLQQVARENPEYARLLGKTQETLKAYTRSEPGHGKTVRTDAWISREVKDDAGLSSKNRRRKRTFDAYGRLVSKDKPGRRDHIPFSKG